MGESLIYLWCYSFFNGERGGGRPFELVVWSSTLSLSKIWKRAAGSVTDGGFFLESGLSGQKEWQEGGRQCSYQSDTSSKKRED